MLIIKRKSSAEKSIENNTTAPDVNLWPSIQPEDKESIVHQFTNWYYLQQSCTKHTLGTKDRKGSIAKQPFLSRGNVEEHPPCNLATLVHSLVHHSGTVQALPLDIPLPHSSNVSNTFFGSPALLGICYLEFYSVGCDSV